MASKRSLITRAWRFLYIGHDDPLIPDSWDWYEWLRWWRREIVAYARYYLKYRPPKVLKFLRQVPVVHHLFPYTSSTVRAWRKRKKYPGAWRWTWMPRAAMTLAWYGLIALVALAVILG